MCSFIQSPIFQYNPNGSSENDAEFSGVVEIRVHHASNIHNICIYEKQDVYAKFSLTYNPDDTVCTRIIPGGGKNPVFKEDLLLKVRQPDAVLKCEIWMLSRAKCYMEDQLLGFALVPLSSVIGRGKLTRDFDLSSTDLFHSPAGTVKLTLSFDTGPSPDHPANPVSDSSADSLVIPELALLDRKASEKSLDFAEYSTIEFPDVNVFKQNEEMVSEYFDLSRIGECSFLQLGGAIHQPVEERNRAAVSTEEDLCPLHLVSSSGSVQNSSMTRLSDDDKCSASSIDRNDLQVGTGFLNSPNVSITMESDQSPSNSPETPTSKKETGEKAHHSRKLEIGKVLTAAPENMSLDAEQSEMQQQIAEMYMKSMQQFTESLAKMKLPVNLDMAKGNPDQGDPINSTSELDGTRKASGSRVFYGSRAFF